MNVLDQQPFKIFPVNKSNLNTYNYDEGNPILKMQWNENFSKSIDPKSLRLCGKFRILNKNSALNQSPANTFDIVGTGGAEQLAQEYVAYIDGRVSVSSIIDTLNIKNLNGNSFEHVTHYNRSLSSLMPVTSSYKDLCSLYGQTFGSQPSNACISRSCAGDIPFALSLKAGYLQNPQPILLSNGGLEISIQLAPTSDVLYGLNANKFTYQISDVYMIGKYLILEDPVSPSNSVTEYSAYYNYLNIVNSGNDHHNIPLNLSRCSQIYQNFVPSTWRTNFSYNTFSTPPLLEAAGAVYSPKKLKSVTFSRGAIRFPYNYDLNFEEVNRNNGYQALRSRTFLNSIFSYAGNRNCSISPFTENVASMVEAAPTLSPACLVTPQHAGQGMVNRWQWASGAAWSRTGNPEKSAHVYGIGLKLDSLNIGESQNYTQASYNYALKSDLDTTVNNSNVFVLASTLVMGNSQGQIVASN